MAQLKLTPDEHGRFVAILQVVAANPTWFGVQSRATAAKAAGQLYDQLVNDEPKPLAQGGPVATGEPFAKETGENGPEPVVPAQIQEMRRMRLPQPHAVRQNDLVAALKRVAEAFPPHTETHHVLALLARELVDPKAPSTAFKPQPNTHCYKPHPLVPGVLCQAELLKKDGQPHNTHWTDLGSQRLSWYTR